MEKDNPVLEGRVGETLAIRGVKHGDVVSLTVGVFPNPRHLVKTMQCISLNWHLAMNPSALYVCRCLSFETTAAFKPFYYVPFPDCWDT